MAIVQAVCLSFKQECLQGIHNFSSSGGDTFKMALYPSTATIGVATTVYSSTDEITASGYTAGGKNLVIPASPAYPQAAGNTAWVDFNDLVWAVSAITGVRGALIYNSSKANRAVAVIDFGADKASVSGDFTVVFPLSDQTNAVVRFA